MTTGCACHYRAGLDGETVQLLKHFPTVVYISCNPATLVANLREVKDTHDIMCAHFAPLLLLFCVASLVGADKERRAVPPEHAVGGAVWRCIWKVEATVCVCLCRRFAIFDQFPGTEHLECGAFLQRKPGVQPPATAKTQTAQPASNLPAAAVNGTAAAAAGTHSAAPSAVEAAEGSNGMPAAAATVAPDQNGTDGS